MPKPTVCQSPCALVMMRDTRCLCIPAHIVCMLLSPCLSTHAPLQDAKLAQLEWLDKEVQARYDPVRSRVADGGWEEMTALFNMKYGTDRTVQALKKWHRVNTDKLTGAEISQGSLTQKELAWLMRAAEERMAQTGKMPQGGWAKLATDFKQHFGVIKTVTSLKEMYYRVRKEAEA